MQQMAHPDVIEIDAASHTGVDNVRQIIEAASFIPVLGGKKVYLIDEAHMLSKAAFNAFLKILEEPPQTVVFMLVTTDPHKIIPTVLSRCFQVFFDPIKHADVVQHLRFICEQEGIAAQPEALTLIAQETEGCMRDALNLLERLRALEELAQTEESALITTNMVLTVLGTIDDDRIGQLLVAISTGVPADVLNAWRRLEMHRFNPSSVWEKLVEALRRALWYKHAVPPDEVLTSDTFKTFVEAVSYERLMSMLEICYTHELAFSKTAAPGTLLELLLLKMVLIHTSTLKKEGPPSILQEKKSVPSVQKVLQPPSVSVLQEHVSSHKKDSIGEPQKHEQHVPLQNDNASMQSRVQPSSLLEETEGLQVEEKLVNAPQKNGVWGSCLAELELIPDPLVVSIFKQCAQQTFNTDEKVLVLTFSKELAFFENWLSTTEKVWKPIIEKFFGTGVLLKPQFDGISLKQRPVVTAPIRQTLPVPPQAAPQQPAPRTASTGAATSSSAQRGTDVRVTKKPEAPVGKVVSPESLIIGSALTQAFPGKLMATEPQENL